MLVVLHKSSYNLLMIVTHDIIKVVGFSNMFKNLATIIARGNDNDDK